jgi:hypothetical protein
MSSLPRHVLAEVMQRQTKPGDLFATCPFTRKQFADHHKWERGNAAHIVPHAIWAMLGLGSNCEFFANANNIIFVDQLVHFNLEAYNTIPSFSLLNVEGAQPPADFPDDVVYQIVFSRRLRPDHPLRSAIKGSTVHLHKGTLPFVAIHFKYFHLMDPHPTGDSILTSCVTDLCVNFMARSQLEKNLPAAASAIFWPDGKAGKIAPPSKRWRRPEKSEIACGKAMVSKTVHLASALFTHKGGGKKPLHYLAQVVHYSQSKHKFDVVFFDKHSEVDLREVIRTYSGRVKKGMAIKVHTYAAADFWKAFRGYADHPGYPMKHSAHMDVQHSSVGVEPPGGGSPGQSAGTHSSVAVEPPGGGSPGQSAGTHSSVAVEHPGGGSPGQSAGTRLHQPLHQLLHQPLHQPATAFTQELQSFGYIVLGPSEALERNCSDELQQHMEMRWDDDGVGGHALYTYEEFLDEYGAEGMERWLAAVQCTPL